MKFFVSATNEEGNDWIAREIEAETFEEAFEELHRQARQRWPGEVWRPTSVTEKPRLEDSGPLHLSLSLGGRF